MAEVSRVWAVLGGGSGSREKIDASCNSSRRINSDGNDNDGGSDNNDSDEGEGNGKGESERERDGRGKKMREGEFFEEGGEGEEVEKEDLGQVIPRKRESPELHF